MNEDVSRQLQEKTSDNIQKLFDLATRIDERVKSLQESEKSLKKDLETLRNSINQTEKDLAIIKDGTSNFSTNVQQVQIGLVELDKRMSSHIVEIDKRMINVESSVTGNSNRWEKIFTFAIQIVWVIVAAWILSTLGLETPP